MIVLSEDIKYESWDNLILSSSNSNFFQSKECYQFYKELSFLEPLLIAVEEDDILVGLACGYILSEKSIVKSVFSKRVIIPGGLLLDDTISESSLSELLEGLKKYFSKRIIYFEIRNLADFSKVKYIFIKNGFTYNQHLNFRIDTSQKQEDLFDKLSTSKQRQIKLSQKNSANQSEITNVADLKQFYQLLSNLYKKIHKPLFPFEFFEKIVTHTFAKLILIKKDNNVLGGILLVIDNMCTYEWFICGQNNQYPQIYPSVMATWAGIEYAAINGYKNFDFMGAGEPDKNYGVREFKSKFGGELVEHGRFLFVNNITLYVVSKTALKLIKSIARK